MFNTLRQYYMI